MGDSLSGKRADYIHPGFVRSHTSYGSSRVPWGVLECLGPSSSISDGPRVKLRAAVGSDTWAARGPGCPGAGCDDRVLSLQMRQRTVVFPVRTLELNMKNAVTLEERDEIVSTLRSSADPVSLSNGSTPDALERHDLLAERGPTAGRGAPARSVP
jgi:hypothetical protein